MASRPVGLVWAGRDPISRGPSAPVLFRALGFSQPGGTTNRPHGATGMSFQSYGGHTLEQEHHV